MKEMKLKLIGMSDMLLHSDRGANPLNPETKAHKALTSKRKKTDDDHMEIARSEYNLGFYNHENVALPGQNVKSMLVGGAKFNKLGTAFKRCVMVIDDWVEIDHSGPKSKSKMWEDAGCVDCRSVKVGQARLMRYRPRLCDWSLTVTVYYDESMVESRQLIAAAEDAGTFVGLGDYRPEKGGIFGRFKVEVA